MKFKSIILSVVFSGLFFYTNAQQLIPIEEEENPPEEEVVQQIAAMSFPRGGESLERGKTYHIKWLRLLTEGTSWENVYLVPASTGHSTLIASQATGSVFWTIPLNQSVGSYKIKLISNTGAESIMENSFSICDNCADPLVLNSPLDESKIAVGLVENISYSGLDENGGFTIELLDAYGNIEQLATGITAKYLAWDTQGYTPGLYKIRVSNNGRSVENINYFRLVDDYFLNSTNSKTFSYDVDGNQVLVSENMKYFDLSGKLVQSQVKNLSEDRILASEPIYDQYDRSAGQTLSAPIISNQFEYQQYFFQNEQGDKYDYDDLNSGNVPSKVGATTGSLGAYYSSGNSDEEFIDQTSYPFSYNTFYDRGTAEVKSSSAPGEEFIDNANHHTYSKVFPVLNDLDGDYLTLYNRLTGKDLESFSGIATKTVSRDQNQKEVITYTDYNGNVLLSGYINIPDGTAYNINYSSESTPLSDGSSITGFLDFYLPGGERSYNVILAGAGTEYTNLLTGATEQLSNYGEVTVSLSPGYYNCIRCSFISYSHNIYDVSFSFYDDLGRQITTIAPAGVKELKTNFNPTTGDLENIPFATYYEYDFQGRLLKTKEPDAGESNFMYRTDGLIRFSQNAKQKANNSFSYTNYDEYGRPLESGEYVGSNFIYDSDALKNQLDITGVNGGIITNPGDRKGWVRTNYDLPDELPTVALTSLDASDAILSEYEVDIAVVEASNSIVLKPGFHVPQGMTFTAVTTETPTSGISGSFTILDQEYTYGAVSYTENQSTKTWYSYDELGRVTYVQTWYKGVFDDPKTVYYYYDFAGNVTDLVYQNGYSDAFYHHYEYDADLRLSKVYAGENSITESNKSQYLQASYEYYLHGPLKRVELGTNLQGVDYYYTVQGWLKSINNPLDMVDKSGFQSDVFAQAFKYFDTSSNDDFNSSDITLPSGSQSDNFNSTISGVKWENTNSSGTDYYSGNMHYSYDDKYQLTQAYNGSNNNYRVNGISYDLNGNIQTLTRRNSSGGILNQDGVNHSFNYTYSNTNNQLNSVSGYANSYLYNEIGEMKQQTLADGSVMAPTYDVSGKVKKILDGSGQLSLTYIYDDKGFRSRKIDHANGSKETFYVRDASGQLLSIYTKEVGQSSYSQDEIPVYGANRLGNYTPGYSIPLMNFELKDHLGNVRSTIQAVDQGFEYSFKDFYPFGMVMRSGGVKGRYDYQGDYSEKDEETGWNHFEAREFDQVVGRWMVPDPARQFWSPYNGLGNNPVSRVDPDGRFSPDSDFRMDENGNITLVKATFDKYDRLFDHNGNLIDDKVRLGVLAEGMNFLTHVNRIKLRISETKASKPAFDSPQDLLLKISMYWEKEVAGFHMINQETKDNILFVLPSSRNDYKTAKSIPWIENKGPKIWLRYQSGRVIYKQTITYQLISWFHTHPGYSKDPHYGEVNPSQGDLDWTDKFMVPGFIYGGKGGFGIMNPQIKK